VTSGDLRSGTWVTYVDGRAAGLNLRRCRLEIVSGPGAPSSCEIETPVIRIGARADCELQLADNRVSGVHCEIRLDERGYRLRDLESTNGTWVGGMRVMDLYISPGTVIGLGATKVRFDPLGGSVQMALATEERCGNLVGRSVRMRELFARIVRVAATETTVLVTGETGTGKELVAEAVHDLSPRAGKPFVVLDCGAIPLNLVESELFGHERGAFTGAATAYAGAFERAHGGTIFLDEIGELPLDLQPKLLRVLERREVRRVGGSKMVATDIRVVAATNRDLAVEVNRGRFREDLYYRLAVAHLRVPALRERKEDIPLLVEHFAAALAAKRGVSAEALELMARHDWPGNVRELRNVVERAVVLEETAPRPVAATPGSALPAAAGELHVPIDVSIPFKTAKGDLVEEFERRYITALLEAHGGNISAAARAAGLDRMSIHKILNRLGLRAT
jgi:DNA-binding NtrC family response regulator